MRTLAALVFPGFQTLDYFGPIEMLGDPEYEIEIITVAKSLDPVPSRHGQKSLLINFCLKKMTMTYCSSQVAMQHWSKLKTKR